MTNNFKSGLLFASAFAVVLTASPASARFKIKNPVKAINNAVVKPATNTVNNAVNTVSNTATTLANNVANSATDAAAKSVGYANFAAAQAKGYANTDLLEEANLEAKANKWSSLVAADTASAAMGFKNYAERMDADSMPVGAAEYSVIRTNAIKNYTAAHSQAAAKYEVARKNLGPVISQANSVANYVANVCKASATSSWGKITPFVNKAKQLDAKTQDSVFRLLRTLARGSTPDQQTASDMLAVGQALGMVSANGLALVGNANKSNFSVSVGGSGGWVAGVNSSVGFAMDTFATNGKYNMAVTVSTGVQVAAGTSALSPGATIGFGLGWAPGSAVDGEGPTITAGGEVGGIDVAAQWSLPPSLAQVLATDVARNGFDVNSLKNALTSSVTDGITAMCQAPGISAGVSLPTSTNLGNVTFSPGYSFVAWKGSI